VVSEKKSGGKRNHKKEGDVRAAERQLLKMRDRKKCLAERGRAVR